MVGCDGQILSNCREALANFLNMSKNPAEFKICQYGRMIDGNSLVNYRLSSRVVWDFITCVLLIYVFLLYCQVSIKVYSVHESVLLPFSQDCFPQRNLTMWTNGITCNPDNNLSNIKSRVNLLLSTCCTIFFSGIPLNYLSIKWLVNTHIL